MRPISFIGSVIQLLILVLYLATTNTNSNSQQHEFAHYSVFLTLSNK
ncbi:hypothetical protein [Mangrovibacterium sp.]